MLSNDVKFWLDSLAVDFVRLFPLSSLLSALHVLRNWEGPLLKALVEKPTQALAYMQNPEETYPPPPRNSVTWQGAYGGSASEWRVLSPTGFVPAPLAMLGPLNQRLHYGRWWGPPTDQAVPPPAVETLSVAVQASPLSISDSAMQPSPPQKVMPHRSEAQASRLGRVCRRGTWTHTRARRSHHCRVFFF